MASMKQRSNSFLADNPATRDPTKLARQHGFTLIEIVMALGVGAIIMAAVGYGMAQLFTINSRNSSHMTAVQEVQNAGYWFSRDAVQAPYDIGNVTAPPPNPPWIWPISASGTVSGSSITLCWRDSGDISVIHRSEISWDAANQTVTRIYDGGAPTAIAHHISDAIFTVNLDVTKKYVANVTLIITSSVTSWHASSTETRTYEIAPRAGQAQ
jgi:prepilin-type N-terminal cleavage/methylation domain-containing protein